MDPYAFHSTLSDVSELCCYLTHPLGEIVLIPYHQVEDVGWQGLNRMPPTPYGNYSKVGV